MFIRCKCTWHVYSPDIPVRSADCIIYIPGIGTPLSTVSSSLGRIQRLRTLLLCSYSQYSCYTRYPSLLSRQRQYGMTSFPNTSTHDQQCESNPSLLILRPMPCPLGHMLPWSSSRVQDDATNISQDQDQPLPHVHDSCLTNVLHFFKFRQDKSMSNWTDQDSSSVALKLRICLEMCQERSWVCMTLVFNVTGPKHNGKTFMYNCCGSNVIVFTYYMIVLDDNMKQK